MKFIADFHIHSKYSRATSGEMDLIGIDKWAKIKGIKVIGSGDFTHPEWLKYLEQNLEPAEQGLFKLKKISSATRFVLTAEISCIYSTRAAAKTQAENLLSWPKKEKVRKIHLLILAPSFKIVKKINARLGRIGNLKSDGRPILGINAKELVKIILDASDNCLIVPAHIMTPWFSVFGSKSGFDSLEECFEEYTDHIFAAETGLSADPSMLWAMPAGRKLTLISNSDAHSPSKLGREANVFEAELNYFSIIKAIKTKDKSKFLYTVEFFPEEGKYYFDGHRNCHIRFSPQESKKHKGVCPVCGKRLTIGVLSRVEELSDRPPGTKLETAIPYKSLVPLEEIIADSLKQSVNTKQVKKRYYELIGKLGSEFNILLDTAENDLKQACRPEISRAIIKVRQGKVIKEPGYDGLFGKIRIFEQEDSQKRFSQKNLFYDKNY